MAMKPERYYIALIIFLYYYTKYYIIIEMVFLLIHLYYVYICHIYFLSQTKILISFLLQYYSGLLLVCIHYFLLGTTADIDRHHNIHNQDI
jgi:hypothetical protein